VPKDTSSSVILEAFLAGRDSTKTGALTILPAGEYRRKKNINSKKGPIGKAYMIVLRDGRGVYVNSHNKPTELTAQEVIKAHEYLNLQVACCSCGNIPDVSDL
jgi:hypothetical protein